MNGDSGALELPVRFRMGNDKGRECVGSEPEGKKWGWKGGTGKLPGNPVPEVGRVERGKGGKGEPQYRSAGTARPLSTVRSWGGDLIWGCLLRVRDPASCFGEACCREPGNPEAGAARELALEDGGESLMRG